jgi:hypothetical protein
MLQSGCDGCLSIAFGWRPPRNAHGGSTRFIAPIRFVRFLVDLLKREAIASADLTDREAATAWGRGRPWTYHGSGSVEQTFRLKQHQEGNGNAPDHWSCGIYGYSFYRCASSRPGLSLLSARPAMGLPGQL